jgi:predicted enzyme related to lactoylglutathione lyase
MISGGLPTVFVSDNGLCIGLHPASERSPAGRKGSITIGFNLDEPIDRVVGRLKKQGVTFTREIFEDGSSRAAHFSDPDGNEFYVIELRAEWQKYAPNSSAA